MVVEFMCEIERFKIDYLLQAFPNCPALFRDMKELRHRKAYDCKSKTYITVPQARLR